MARHSLTVRSRFALVLVVLVPALLAIAAAGIYGLHSERSAASSLYLDHVRTARTATDLGVHLGVAEVTSLELLLDHDNPAETTALTVQYLSKVIPEVDSAITAMQANAAGDRSETEAVDTITTGWAAVQELRPDDVSSVGNSASLAVEGRKLQATFAPMTAAAASIVSIEAAQARSSYQKALASYDSSLRLMLLVLAVGLAIASGVVIWLIRSVLTRTLSYSAFARAVSEGDFSRRLAPRGSDELDQLGTTLEALAVRRESAERYDAKKLDFSDTLQLAESEQEAHNLLKRYLELSISESTVAILNRNNSADRLEAVTALRAGSPLLQSLDGAKPRSCLAIRMARPHRGVPDTDPLLACAVCSTYPERTTCMPFLVGGEVIGSVLAGHDQELSDIEERSLREAVTQSAPVLGNLRNLAIAELRSATDTLTGLPNRRAIEDTLKRMVAQASRTISPLAALMCDLDHFKRVNDQYGHGSGDDLLAAVGAVLRDTLRDADFAGRYGGEEFLILLPATSEEGAVTIAEKVRAAVSAISVPSVAQRVTLSVGLAVLPDHANDAGSLQRAADRALYTAKNAGRDRTEVFSTDYLTPSPAALANGSTARTMTSTAE